MSRLPILLVALIAVSGCSTMPNAESKRPASDSAVAAALTAGGEWRVTAATSPGGATLTDVFAGGSKFTLRFANQLSVRGGCNGMSAPWHMAHGQLMIGDLAATRMACTNGRMDADAALSRRLVFPLKVTMQGPAAAPTSVTLTTPSGEVLTLVRASAPSRGTTP